MNQIQNCHKLSVHPWMTTLAVFLVPLTAGAQDLTWRQASTSGPSARSGSVMVYDSNRAVTVLFGGASNQVRLNDIWEWDGQSWSQRTVSGTIPRLWSASGVYDSQRQRVIVFGGADSNGAPNNNTYEYDGSQWRRVATTGPGARNYLWQLAYDSRRGRTVLYGGGSFTGGPERSDTWEWDGTSWQQLAVDGPPASTSHGMVFDQDRGVTVMLVSRSSSSPYAQTWEWDGNTWRHAATAGPSSSISDYLRLAYDEERKVTLAFGTNIDVSNATNELWEYNGTTWTQRVVTPQPSSRSVHMVAYDSARRHLVTFGGFGTTADRGDTWILNNFPTSDGWTTRNLHTTGFKSNALDVQDGQVVGTSRLATSYTRPFVYTISTGTFVDLLPSGAGGTGAQVYGCGGGQQVGYTDLGGLHGGGMWRSTAGSWLDLRPQGGNSILYDTDGLQQVGHVDVPGGSRASVWSGDRQSYTSLHIANAVSTYAFGVGSGQQVGISQIPFDAACYWSGTAASYTNLHPAGATRSVARGAHSGRQLGDVEIAGVPRATLWNGSATDWVDLNPLGALSSQGMKTYRELQAGTAVFAGGVRRAGIWRGTAESWKDLSVYLPDGFTHSDGRSVWYDDTGTYVAGYAVRASTGQEEAFLWVGPPQGDCFSTSISADVSVCGGEMATFSIEATGNGPFTYQWHRDGTPLNPAANPTALTEQLIIPSVSAADIGSYTCDITNNCATVTSLPAQLSLTGDPTSIQTQPSDRLINSGQTALFLVSATGTEMTYRWYKNGSMLADADGHLGTTTPSLTVSNVQRVNQGRYSCVVTGTCGSATTHAALLTVPACEPTWIKNNPSPWETRWVHAQAFDEVSRSTVVFGGRNTLNVTLGDTWRMTDGRWNQFEGMSPSARSDHAMATWGSNGVLMFGGKSRSQSSSSLNDTWGWDGSGWNQIQVAGPSARVGHKMVYDTSRNRVVLFGGVGSTDELLGDTWEWDGANWILMSEVGPSPRFAHSMAYDPIRDRVVMFGGFASAGLVRDTWEWDGVQWQLQSLTGPTARFYADAAFDELIGRVTVFGGLQGGNTPLNDAWMWTGSAWESRAALVVPEPRWTHAMSYDNNIQGLVVTGGAGSGSVRFDDSWVLSSGPLLLSVPQNMEVVSPSRLDLEVVARGNGQLTYQWQRNGQNLLNGGRVSGARSPVLSINNAEPADSAEYRVIVQGQCMTVVSQPVDVGVYCPADFNRDGGVDGSDVEAFFTVWESGEPSSDVNQDGGVDGSDVEYFFGRWEAAC